MLLFERLKRSTREFFAVFLWEVSKSIFGAIVAVGGVSLALGHFNLGTTLQAHRLILGSFLGSFGAVLLIRSYYTWKYHTIPKQKYDFAHITRDISFEYKSNSDCVYRKKIELKALRAGLSFYTDKYRWTGKNPPVIRSSIKGQSIRLTERKSVWQFYAIEFGRSLNKAEIIETDLVFDLHDEDHAFVPFVSTNIEEPTTNLVLKLRVPPELGVSDAKCEIASCIGARVPFSTTTRKLDRDGFVEWRVARPEMHRYYELSWTKPAGTEHDKTNHPINGA